MYQMRCHIVQFLYDLCDAKQEQQFQQVKKVQFS